MSRPRVGESRPIARNRACTGVNAPAKSPRSGAEASCCSASSSAACRLGKIVADARARLVERRAPARQLARRLFGAGKRVARLPERMLRIAPGLPRCALLGRQLPRRLFGVRQGCFGRAQIDASRATASASSSSSRFFCASRCAAAVGASALAVKPSQRHSAPSRLTSRWPGASKI